MSRKFREYYKKIILKLVHSRYLQVYFSLPKTLNFSFNKLENAVRDLKQDFTADLKYNDNGDCSYVFIPVIDDLPVSQPAFSSSKSKISIRTMCEICLKLTIKTPDQRY